MELLFFTPGEKHQRTRLDTDTAETDTAQTLPKTDFALTPLFHTDTARTQTNYDQTFDKSLSHFVLNSFSPGGFDWRFVLRHAESLVPHSPDRHRVFRSHF